MFLNLKSQAFNKMEADNPAIDQEINNIKNLIPEPFNQKSTLSFISHQSFRQLASLQYFNQNNSFFHDPIIPNSIMSTCIKFNQAIKAKKRDLELPLSDDTDENYENSLENIQQIYAINHDKKPVITTFSYLSEKEEENSSPDDEIKDEEIQPDISIEMNHTIIPETTKAKPQPEVKTKKNQKKTKRYSYENDYDEDDDDYSVDDESDGEYINTSPIHLKATPKPVKSKRIEKVKKQETKEERILEKKKVAASTKTKEIHKEEKPVITRMTETEASIDVQPISPAILEKYGIVIDHIDQFFSLLSNFGYGHFLTVANELGIESQKEEISFYSITAAVILLFRMLPSGMYTKYQNLLLTLSRLVTRFDLSLITNSSPKKISSAQSDKPTEAFKIYLKNSTEQAVFDLENVFCDYYKSINIEDYLTILEVRCAYDNWLLAMKRKGNIERVPLDLLPPSSLSHYDNTIMSSLEKHKVFEPQMKPRLVDFTNLFTYVNIIDGLDNKIIVSEWTKPEMDKIKMALLNFGSDHTSTIEFLAKTYIITKSFRSIIDFIENFLEQMPEIDDGIYSEPELDEEEIEQGDLDLDQKILRLLVRNTNVYRIIQGIIDDPQDVKLNRKEMQFIKVVSKFGLSYFNKILLDRRFEIKSPPLTLENVNTFINTIKEVY